MNKSPLDNINNPIKLEREVSATEQVVKEILSVKNIKTKTDLNDALVVGLTRGTIFSSLFKSKNMQMLVDNISLYRISLKREGRKELKEMVRSLATAQEIEEQKNSLKARLTGGL